VTPAERDNVPRWRPGDGGGHAESWFIKANDPAGGRAIWIRFTVLSPEGRPGDAVVEVWAVAFDRETNTSGKDTFPAAAAHVGGSPLRIAAGESTLEPGRTRGRVRAGGGTIAWDLRFPGDAPALHLFPVDALYELDRFPRQKLTTPVPDARFAGSIEVSGEAWAVDGWPGMQGHNWGRGHTHRYAWAHVNTFEGAPGTVFEGASARLAVGPLVTPPLTVAVLRHRGREHDFRGLRSWLGASDVRRGRWSFVLDSAAARLSGTLEARDDDTVALDYLEPDGRRARCFNSKLASCRLVLEERTRRRGLETVATLLAGGTAALEILER
jgi:hypothetical protein